MRGSRRLSDAEVTAALSAARGARNRAFLGALIYLGGRISEVLQLDLEDVCRGGLREAPIFVAEVTFRRSTTKGRRRGRALALHAQLRALLAIYLERERGMEPGPLFLARAGGKGQAEDRRLSRTQGWKIVHQALEAAGVRDRATPHSFRKTFGARAHAEGARAKTVQEMLGHADLRTTELYLESTEDAERAAVLSMPSYLGEPSP